MKILIVGDTHGNAEFLRTYIFPVAMTVGADAIVQLGDFGAWEHRTAGASFMDEVGKLATASVIPLYWLHGNHDKHSTTLALYTPDTRGFYECRDLLFYIPQGLSWSWGGVDMRAFGGAYSVDKAWRLTREAQLGRRPGTLWFPEEQMTDAQMDGLLAADSRPKQLIFSHDKPLSARPRWNRKAFPECIPNQVRLERALRTHKPLYWFHGHLHYHYLDEIQGDGFSTVVVGLEPDWDAAEPGWKKVHTWAVAQLAAGEVTVQLGRQVHLDGERMQEHIKALD